MKIHLIFLFYFLFGVNFSYSQFEQFAALANNEIRYDTLKNEKYKMVMTLPKTIYKQYEPVVAKFEVVNNDSLPFGIYDIFWAEANYLRTIKTVDNLGKIYNVNQTPGNILVYYKNPSYTVMPGDTFIISMPINNWGSYNNYSLLSQAGYFPANRNYETQFTNEQFTSNSVKFEVIELSKDDSIIINILMNIPVDTNTLKNYDQSIFFEHIYAKYFLKSIDNYYEFLEKYPTTYYMYYNFYMSKFYTDQFNDENNFDETLSTIRNNIKSEQFKQYLNNKAIVQRIKEILKNFKPHTKKNKK